MKYRVVIVPQSSSACDKKILEMAELGYEPISIAKADDLTTYQLAILFKKVKQK